MCIWANGVVDGGASGMDRWVGVARDWSGKGRALQTFGGSGWANRVGAGPMGMQMGGAGGWKLWGWLDWGVGLEGRRVVGERRIGASECLGTCSASVNQIRRGGEGRGARARATQLAGLWTRKHGTPG